MRKLCTAEIIAIGSELLTPLRSDTNSLFLTRKLNEVGIEVRRKTVVGDDVDDLIKAIRDGMTRTDLLITMGGLGPTEDDRTREAVSCATGKRFVRDDSWIAYMTERFARAGRPLTENNLRQADLLEGAELLRNQFGTAPGQWIPGDCTILMLPGPPREVYPMFEREVMRRIAGQAGGVAMHTRILRITGLTESYTDSLVGPIYKNLQNPSVTILASPGAIELHLRAIADGRHTADELIADVEEKFRQKLGDRIYGIDDETLEMVVGRKLQVMGCTIATAESCTGGLLTARLTDVPGSSAYLLRGYVCYTNRSKIHDVGVSPELIETFGAVSAPVAEAMASGVRSRSDADLGVSITGIAGPSGGTETKPVGLVYISVATMKRVQTTENRFLGERPIVRFQATQRALDMVRMSLSEESAS